MQNNVANISRYVQLSLKGPKASAVFYRMNVVVKKKGASGREGTGSVRTDRVHREGSVLRLVRKQIPSVAGVRSYSTGTPTGVQVCRAAEACSMEAAAALPPEQSVRLLHSLIGESDEDDVVIAAIKVMSRVGHFSIARSLALDLWLLPPFAWEYRPESSTEEMGCTKTRGSSLRPPVDSSSLEPKLQSYS